MTTITTIKSPTKDGPVEVTGRVAMLQVGGKRLKCFLQDKPAHLLEYRTGMVFPTIHGAGTTRNDVRVYLMATTHPGLKVSDRAIAQRQLDDLVASKGADKILETIAKIPTLNE